MGGCGRGNSHTGTTLPTFLFQQGSAALPSCCPQTPFSRHGGSTGFNSLSFLSRASWNNEGAVSLFSSSPSSSSSSSSSATTQPSTPRPLSSLMIRDCLYGELGQVADIVTSSFYVNATTPWKQMYRMGELNRLQQGFSYRLGDDAKLHRMLVAVLHQQQQQQQSSSSNNQSGATCTTTHNDKKNSKKNEIIVGFCDIDARTPNRPTGFDYNPRPYLSDLCIDPAWRRQGVATALVAACEKLCWNDWSRNEVFIRVESHNQAAVHMYQQLGYVPLGDSDKPIIITMNDLKDQRTTNKDKILLLRKELP